MTAGTYRQVFSLGWSSGFVYRLNFVMWRVRNVIQLLAIYLLWSAILQHNPTPAGYTAPELLTYILLTSFIRALVFSSQSIQVQSQISNGDLNNFLIRPMNYFAYWLSLDFADKVLNILFSIAEITLLFIILKPPFVLPPNSFYFLSFIAAAIVAMFLYFFFSLIISLSVFWMPEGNGWPQRFFVFTMMEFFAGGLFPLDMLPQPIYRLFLSLPFAYMGSVPIQIYLGRLSPENVGLSFLIMGFWLMVLIALSLRLFKKGLKIYGAYGR